MNKNLKGFLSVLLCLVMVLPTVGSFVATAASNQFFFDSFNEDYIVGTAAENYTAGAVGQVSSYWAYIYNYANGGKTGATGAMYMEINPHDTINNYLSYELRDSQNESDIAMKLTNISGEVSYPAYFGSKQLDGDAVLHVGYDFKSTDYNSVTKICNNGKTLNYFETDNKGYLYLLGNKTNVKYTLNKWCKVDLYYNRTTGTWYLFADDTFVTEGEAGTDYSIEWVDRMIYTVSANAASSSDVFNMDNVCVCLEDALPEIPDFPEDYTAPQVDIVSPSDGESFIYDDVETVVIEAAPDVYNDEVTAVNFYINDTFVGSDASTPYEYTWTVPNNPGIYKIRAEVIDSLGGVKSDEISVVVVANCPPTVDFMGLQESNSIYLDKKLDFSIVASDADGSIVKTEFYINNELHDTFTTAEKTYSLNFDTNGRYILKTVTYDDRNGKNEKECIVNVLAKSENTIAQNIDFNSFDVGQNFTNSSSIKVDDDKPEAIHFYGDGKKEIKTYNGNKYLSVGASETDTGVKDTPFMAATFNIDNAVFDYETDIYFSRNNIDHYTNFAYKDKDNANQHLFLLSFNKEGKVTLNGTEIGNYSADTWYRLKIKLDTPNKTCDVTFTNLNNPDDTCNGTCNFNNSLAYKLVNIRIYASFTDKNPGFIGYDNIHMHYTSSYPSILGFDSITADNESMNCDIGNGWEKIEADDIILENEYGEVTVDSVTVKDNKLIITPKDGFVSSTKYNVTIKSTALLANGEPIGFDTIAAVTTAPKPLDVTNGSFTSDLSGIVFNADLVNTTSAPKTVTIVTATYKGETLVDVFSKTVTITATGSVPAQPIPIDASFDNVKAFVINDWSSGIPLSAKVFSFNQ